jgi:hypothetical protein
MRVEPLPVDEWDEAVQRSLADMLPGDRRNPRDADNLPAALPRHPELACARFLDSAGIC